MGKRISVILIVVLAAAAVTFGVLWQSALRDHSDIKALAQAGANEACSRFSDFQKRGDDGDYWGVPHLSASSHPPDGGDASGR